MRAINNDGRVTLVTPVMTKVLYGRVDVGVDVNCDPTRSPTQVPDPTRLNFPWIEAELFALCGMRMYACSGHSGI